MSTYLSNKYFTFFHKPKSRTEITFKFGKNKAEHPHDRSLKFEWSFHKRPSWGTYLEREENQATYAIQLVFFSLFITYSGLVNYIIHGADTWRYSLSIHGWILWWNFGCEPHSWSSKDGWRNSNFDFLDFLFGKLKHDKKNKEEHTKTVKLPEGEYDAEMKFEDFIRWRTRIPNFIWKGVVRRVDLKITPEIPYPGKNDPVDGYSQCSFPAKDVEEVLDHIYQDIKKRRRGDLDYYANDYRKMVDDYTYTVNGLPINIGRVPVEWRNKEWHPIGCSSSRIADETFRKLWNKKESFTPEESVFINKYMRVSNSIDFIKSPSQKKIQEDMKDYFKTRDMDIGSVDASSSYAVPKGI